MNNYGFYASQPWQQNQLCAVPQEQSTDIKQYQPIPFFQTQQPFQTYQPFQQPFQQYNPTVNQPEQFGNLEVSESFSNRNCEKPSNAAAFAIFASALGVFGFGALTKLINPLSAVGLIITSAIGTTMLVDKSSSFEYNSPSGHSLNFNRSRW